MSLGHQLAVLVARGLFSLEDLDVATPASRELELDRMRSGDGHHGHGGGWPGRRGPAMRYPGAGCIQPVRNLAREWIAAHPGDWQALLRHHQLAGQPGDEPAGPLTGRQLESPAPSLRSPQPVLPLNSDQAHRPGTASGPGHASKSTFVKRVNSC
jgi:hypothetical protein